MLEQIENKSGGKYYNTPSTQDRTQLHSSGKRDWSSPKVDGVLNKIKSDLNAESFQTPKKNNRREDSSSKDKKLN